MRWFYNLTSNTYALAGRTLFRWRVSGLEHLPRGPFIIAANHISVHDPPLICGAVTTRLHVRWLAKRQLYDMGILGTVLHGLDCIQLRQEGTDFKALRTALAHLRAGGVVGIFPEGGLSTVEKPREARGGVAVLAHMGKVPVVPIGISGTRTLLQWRGSWPILGTIRIRCGPPLPPPDARRLKEEQREAFMEHLMSRISGLTDACERPLMLERG